MTDGDAPTTPPAISRLDKLMMITNLITCVPALLDIFTTLFKTLQQRLVFENPTTEKEVWDILALIFNDNKQSRSYALKAELRSMKLGDLSIDAYFYKIESIVIILSSVRSPISNDDMVNIALDGLPNKYQHVSDIIIHQDPFLDIKTVRSMLTTMEMSLKSRAQTRYVDSTSSSPLVLLANFGDNVWRSISSMKKVNKPCFNFNKDSCRFGEYCKFLHNGVHGNPSLWSNNAPRSQHTSSSNLTQTSIATLQTLLAKTGCNENSNNASPNSNSSMPNNIVNSFPLALHTSIVRSGLSYDTSLGPPGFVNTSVAQNGYYSPAHNVYYSMPILLDFVQPNLLNSPLT
uniref:Hybrid signal transduction histidine kinase M n=1 Tax=Tanacetum cinerariifolium TaxID=118510 RepID=A0A6L2LXB3_TANCI|nr:hybrid signal transduction histidine kinase M [Tanacetum cinerariifolium]